MYVTLLDVIYLIFFFLQKTVFNEYTHRIKI